MSIVLKPAELNIKNSDGQYIGINSVVDKTTAEMIEEITEAKNAGVLEINTNAETAKAAIVAEGERVVGTIPADYTQMTHDVSVLKTETTDIETRLTETESTVGTHTTNISNLTEKTNDLTEDVGTNTSDISTLKGDFAQLSDEITEIYDVINEPVSAVLEDFVYGLSGTNRIVRNSSTSWKSVAIPVKENEKYHIVTTVFNVTYYGIYFGISSDGTTSPIEKYGIATSAVNTKIDIYVNVPNGARYMYINCHTGGYDDFSISKAFSINEIDDIKEILNDKAIIRFCNTDKIGDCTLIKLRNGHVGVIDFGAYDTRTNTDQAQSITDLGIKHIDFAIISHYHNDHVQNINRFMLAVYGNVIDGNTVFYLPPIPPESYLASVSGGSKVKEQYDRVMGLINGKGCVCNYPTENETISFGKDSITFFNCDHTDYYTAVADYNNCSLGCYVNIGDISVCFTGDMAQMAQSKYRESMKKCDILKAPHHAIAYPTDGVWFNTINPEMCVSTCGATYAQAKTGTTNANYFTDSKTGFQQFCEDRFVSNYVVGAFDNHLDVEISEFGYSIKNGRKCIRTDEGLYS